MFTNLDLYYLNHMGIRPWLSKKSFGTTVIELAEKTKLLVLTPPNLTTKEQSLLEKIISFIDLEQNDLKRLEIKSGEKSLSLSLRADCILSVGLSKTSLIGLESSKFIAEIDVLKNILSNPLTKKKIFKQLVSLKEILAGL